MTHWRFPNMSFPPPPSPTILLVGAGRHLRLVVLDVGQEEPEDLPAVQGVRKRRLLPPRHGGLRVAHHRHHQDAQDHPGVHRGEAQEVQQRPYQMPHLHLQVGRLTLWHILRQVGKI